MPQTRLNLSLPEPLYKQLEVQAQAIARSVNELVVSTLTRHFQHPAYEEDIAPALQAELKAMENLSDEVLWQIAQSRLNNDKVALYDVLLERYHANTLTSEGRNWLDRLREESEALMLRKAHAYTLLQSRGNKPGPEMISPKDGMVQVYVPAGEFLMGSRDDDPDGSDDEKPQHTVHLDAYWIDKTPVTNAMFAKFVAETGYNPNSDWRSKAGSGRENHPVVYLSWDDAQAYCQWAERRLPTEAEWEKAAGGTDGRKWPWGNNPPTGKLCNFNMNIKDTTPVGNYPAGASPYGALDMAGNVYEWCRDTFDAGYYAKSPKDIPWDNPFNESPNGNQVIRGGSYWSTERYTRARNRVRDGALLYRGSFRGFRGARSHTLLP